MGTGRRILGWVVFALVFLSGVGATGALVTGALLTDSYRPELTEAYEPLGIPPEAVEHVDRPGSDGIRALETGQVSATLVFGVFGLISGVALLGVAVRAGASTGRRITIAAATLVVIIAATVTWVSRSLVRWDQVALRTVTVGTDFSGYWPAAFDDRVRFIIIDGVEVSQGSYALILIVHLAAPVVGLIALGIAGWITASSPVRRTPSS